MSYGHNDASDGYANGYANGYRNTDQSSRYNDGYGDAGSVEGRRTPRLGGYGGLGSNGIPEQEDYSQSGLMGADRRYPSNPPASPRWRQARAPNSYDNLERVTYGNGPGGRQIEDVIQHISAKWSVLIGGDCVPVHIALQLLDNSSLGRGQDYFDFQQTSKTLQTALKTIVNEHHQGFNSSIGTFHKIQTSIQTSQSRIKILKSSLLDAQSNLTTAKPELKDLAVATQNYDEMLQVLGQIEKIQAVPEELDTCISDKHFLTAVDVLQDGLRLIGHANLESIGALADLRVYLSNQETSLIDILLEELHDHLYLKSPYCQGRWKAYSPHGNDVLDTDPNAAARGFGVRPLYRFLSNLDTKSTMIDDTSRDLEADSFEYLHMIIEALNKMGRLETAVDRMEQRLPTELFAVVHKTIQEVDSRHLPHTRSTQMTDRSRASINFNTVDSSEAIMNDLLYTLYSKFEAIAEGHRAVHDVVAGIMKRESLGKSDKLLTGFKELWKLYQSEMRSLLHDYLATSGHPEYNTRATAGLESNIFERVPRDRQKRVFKLGEIDKRSTQITVEHEDLDKIMQASVPGLVSKSHRQSGIYQGDRDATTEAPATGHKLLVEPSVFNISLLLPPSLTFLQRLKEIMPQDSDIDVGSLTSFLDRSLTDVFSPQLEETVTESCAQALSESDGFVKDNQWANHARRPIFQGTISFFTQIKAFCTMLDHIPSDEAFPRLLITQLRMYFDNCLVWYRALVSRAQVGGGVRLKPAAEIPETGELSVLMERLWAEQETPEREGLMRKAVDLLIAQTNEKPLDPFDIISDSRSVSSLCLLYSSMQWLASHLDKLRHVVGDEVMPVQDSNNRKHHRWTMLLSTANMRDDEKATHLHMTQESVRHFDEIVASYRNLAKRAMYTLNVDIRYGIIHMMSRVLLSHYYLEQPTNEADPSIKSLNADLLSFDDNLTNHLPDQERRFITSGLGLLLDNYLVTNASRITIMNEHGCGRMQLNILVLQQNLKNIEADVVLSRSALFFGHFHQDAKAIVEKAKATGGQDMGMNLEEAKALVGLCYSEALQSPQREVAANAKKAMADDMLQLTEYMWSS